MKLTKLIVGLPLVAILALLLPMKGFAQSGPTTHTIFMTAMEVKGGTSADKLAPPAVNPADLSKGYGFKGPGEANKSDPKRWEVWSYIFSPAFLTVRQGDKVDLTIFVVNGDTHADSFLADPDGRKIVSDITFNRGREHKISFVAEKAGAYQLTCAEHAPTMSATILALPR
jgi:plastocyanin